MNNVVPRSRDQVEGDRGMILNDPNSHDANEKLNASMPSDDLTLLSGNIAGPASHRQILPEAHSYSPFRNESCLFSSHWVIDIVTP
jgi:hypothetical protein